MQALSDTGDMIFDAYELELRVKRLDPASAKGYRGVRDRFLRWCREQGVEPAEVDRLGMLRYFAEMDDLAPSTVHRHWTQLHAVYRRAAGPRYALIDNDPTDDLPLPPVRQSRPFAYSADDLRSIRAAITRPQDWCAFHLLAYTGMRSVEVRHLRWEHVNLKRNELTVHGKRTRRGDDVRTLPIHPALRTVLLEQRYRLDAYVLDQGRPPGSPISQSQIAFYIRRNTGSIVRPPGEACHPIRRAVASSLRRNGVDLDTIDQLLGWRPASMRARRYMAFEPADMHSAILRLWVDDPLEQRG